MAHALEIRMLEGSFALARLQRDATIPTFPHGSFSAIVVSEHGATLVCREDLVPTGAESATGFTCLTVASVFELESVGIVAAVTQPLAAAGISLFAYSTWETDYILVQKRDVDAAVEVLTRTGHHLLDGQWPGGQRQPVNPAPAARPRGSR